MSDIVFHRLSGLDVETPETGRIEYEISVLKAEYEKIGDEISKLSRTAHKIRLGILKSHIVNMANKYGGVYYSTTGTQVKPEKLYKDILEFYDRYATFTIIDGNTITVKQRGGNSRVYIFGQKEASE